MAAYDYVLGCGSGGHDWTARPGHSNTPRHNGGTGSRLKPLLLLLAHHNAIVALFDGQLLQILGATIRIECLQVGVRLRIQMDELTLGSRLWWLLLLWSG